MGSLGVASGLDLSGGLLGEADAEHSDNVSVGGLGLHESLDKSVPLLDHGASFVSGDVHAVEVGVAIKALNLINLELKLSPVLSIRGVVAISKSGGENTTSQAVS